MQSLKKTTQTEMEKETILSQPVHEEKGHDQQKIWETTAHESTKENPSDPS